MPSQINYTSIDATFPIAGQNNSSQGFRDNFANIRTNLLTAYTEISNLQANSIVIGGTNDLTGTNINNAIINGGRELEYNFGSVSGAQTVDYNNGTYQIITLGGSTVVTNIVNWPAASEGTRAKMIIEVDVPNVASTFTFPDTVNLNMETIAGASGHTVTFQNIGVFAFELSSNDGGANMSISDLSRNRNTVEDNLGVYGNVTAQNFIGNFVSSGSDLMLSGNIDATNVNATGIYGNIMSPIQTSITTLGSLNSLSVTGDANVGNVTVTGITDMCGGTAYGVQYVTPATGTSVQLLSNVGVSIINPTGTIAALTLLMPATPMNGQSIDVTFGNAVTSLGLTPAPGSGHTVIGQSSNVSISSGAVGSWIFYNNTWYILHALQA